MHVLTLSSKIDDTPIRISRNIKRATGDYFLWKMDPNGERAERAGRWRERGRGRGQITFVPDEIRATLVDHVVHGMTMREAGQRVQQNVSRFTVASIIRTFREENRYLIFAKDTVQYSTGFLYFLDLQLKFR